jgi:hypothetical protein
LNLTLPQRQPPSSVVMEITRVFLTAARADLVDCEA